MRKWIKQIADQFAVTLVQSRIRIVLISRKFLAALGSAAISLLAVTASFAALYFPKLREALNAQSVETILSQLGATFGTTLSASFSSPAPD